MVHAQYMASDAGQVQETELDYAPVLGVWTNLYPDTHHLLKISLAETEGTFTLHAWGAGVDGPVDLGSAPATMCAVNGTATPQGCYACLETPTGKTRVTINVTGGIQVVQTYTSYEDGSGRRNYFTKEYFRREETGQGRG